MNEIELVDLFSKTFTFWDKLSDTDKRTMCRTANQVKFKKGINIHDGNECTGVIIPQSGSLRIYMLSEEGKEVTLYRVFPGELCMFSASCVLDMITFDVFVDAEENSDCIVVGGCIIEDLFNRVPEVKTFVLESALSRFSDIMWVMQQILFMSMDKRLAIFLLDESANKQSDVITLTHEQIAKYMGSAREVVSRMLKYFSSEGIVEVSRGGIKLIDKNRLRELSS